MIKGILFDKDGTLIEFEVMWHQIVSKVFEDMSNRFGLGFDQIEALKKRAGFLDDGFEEESQIQVMTTSEIAKDWSKFIEKKGWKDVSEEAIGALIEKSAVDPMIEAISLPGTREILHYLKDKGYHLGVATADTMVSARYSLDKAGLLEYFDYIGADDGLLQPKPNPDMALAFCRKVGIAKNQLLVIGDSMNDMEFAKQSGAMFVGIGGEHNLFGSYRNVTKQIHIVDSIQEAVYKLKL